MNPANLQKLEVLEAQGYPKEGVQRLFALPIQKIAGKEDNHRQLIAFFQQAAPRLLSIMRHRQEMARRMNHTERPNNTDTKASMTLLEKIENSTIEF